MESNIEKEQIVCPSIVFKVKETLYSINSKNVTSIMQLPQYHAIPNAPDGISGIFTLRGEAVPMLDLRVVFGIPSLSQEYVEFSQMLEDRKQDHIRWVNELERCIEENEPFTLATDPHKCAFGKWYDSYQIDNHTINHHLRKLEDPHRRLHLAAEEVQKCRRDCQHCTRPVCLKTILDQVKREYMPTILTLLDDAKELFKTAYHEMVLVLGETRQLGIIVDEVVAVEDLADLDSLHSFEQFGNTDYVCGVHKSENLPGLILELDESKLSDFLAAIPQ